MPGNGGGTDIEIPIDVDVAPDCTTERLCRWAKGLLKVGLFCSFLGVYGLYKANPTWIDAAAIESGKRPAVWRAGWPSRMQPNPYLVTGRLLEVKTMAIPHIGVPCACAPLVSKGAKPGQSPSIYFVGYATEFWA